MARVAPLSDGRRDPWIETPQRPRGPVLTIRVDPVNRVAIVRGWQTKRFLLLIGGRPMWSRAAEAWSTRSIHVPDITALAEVEGFEVDVRERGAA
jgi:hypothetical protein